MGDIHIADQEDCTDPIGGEGLTLSRCQIGDGYCDLICPPNTALFAPIQQYVVCGPLGVWNNKVPTESLLLPGCSGMLIYSNFRCIDVL